MIIEELLFEEESSTLDFKQEQYSFINSNDHQKSELLKDILAFANAWRRNEAYILIGVEEIKGSRSNILGVDNDLDDSDLQQFVNSKTQRPLIFEYKNVQVDGKNIGIIKIPINERPIYLNKDYGKLKKHTVYIRRGSSTEIATPDEIAKMGASYQSEKNVPILKLAFANAETKICIGENFNTTSKVLKLPKSTEIPDYQESKSHNSFDILASHRSVNKNYYRELVKFYYLKTIRQPISFCISNTSDFAATDLKIEVLVDNTDDNIHFILEDELPEEPYANYDYLNNLHNMKSLPEQMADMQNKPDIIIKSIGSIWHIDIMFQKVRAGQTVFTQDTLYFSSKESGEVNFAYNIFADNLPSPIQGSLSINVQVQKKESSLEEIQELRYQEFLTKHRS